MRGGVQLRGGGSHLETIALTSFKSHFLGLHSFNRGRIVVQKLRLPAVLKCHYSAADSGVPRHVGAEQRNLIVVGGGAAGVYGALRAKELCPGLDVLVLEKGKLLSKVRISGGGRCNVTTGLFDDDSSLLAGQYPRGHKELRGSFFRTHGPQDTAAWFRSRGIPLKTESDGRMFPVSDDSVTIIDCLLNEARRIGVTLKTKAQVRGVSKEGMKFKVSLEDLKSGTEDVVNADNVLLATGSAIQGYKFAEQLGHSIVEPRPSLFTFKVPDAELTEMSGVSFERVTAKLELPKQTPRNLELIQDGPLLVTHRGFSGPVILRLSAWGARLLHSSEYKGTLLIDFIPEDDLEDLKVHLMQHKSKSEKRALGSFVPAPMKMGRRFWLYLLQRQGLDKDAAWGRVPSKTLSDFASLIKKCPFEVSGKGAFKEEFVTAGGVPLVEVDLRTMESRKCPGLYFAGEILDIDGVTGGFNFQNAWTGGFIAGSSVATSRHHSSLAA